MNNYYVYQYIRLDTNEVFYVGKGKGTRYRQLSNRNKHFTHIVNSVPYKVVKILENISNSDACEAEMSFIAYRKSIGQASCNFTAGGEGTVGLIPWNKGKPYFNEAATRAAAIKKQIKIKDTKTGQIYPSIKAAAKAIDISESQLSKMLRGQFKNWSNLTYAVGG